MPNDETVLAAIATGLAGILCLLLGHYGWYWKYSEQLKGVGAVLCLMVGAFKL